MSPFRGSIVGRFVARLQICLTISVIATITLPSRVLGEDEPLPKADTILDRYVEVTGGKEKYEKLKSMIITGEVHVLPETKLRLKSYHAAPDRMYISLDSSQLGLTQQGYDKGVAWDKGPSFGPRIRTGVDNEHSKRQAQFNPELRWRELYKEATTVGVENVHSKPAYRIELIPNVGRAEHQFYDKDSGFLVKSVSSIENEKGGDEPLEQLYLDYKETDGVVAARRIVQIRGAQKVIMNIEKIEYNVDMPADRFDPPADVKALIEQGKTEKPEEKKP